jgi:beta-lactamase regulating signal transducer with metallopeptidase domain
MNMMLQVMAYTIAVAAALSIVGLCLERVARLHGRPRRMAWMVAMLLSVMFPAAMILVARPAAIEVVPAPVIEQDLPYIIPAPVDVAEASVATGPAQFMPVIPSPGSAPRSTWTLPQPSDRQLITAWIAASSVMAFYLLGANLLLRRRAADWQKSTAQDQEILVSEVTGPALLGVFSPRIVVPRWLMLQPAAIQSLILEHERQHRAARDPLLVFTGLLLITAAPWNVPLWWLWRRLRQAIELDCDARVVRHGAEANTYAEALLAVTRRTTRIPAGALAMSEPVHALETRIASLMPEAMPHAKLQAIAALVIAAAGAGAAWALEAPALPRRVADIAHAPMSSPVSSSLIVASPAVVVAAAQSSIATGAPAPAAPNTEPGPAVQSPTPAQPGPEPANFMVRILDPVAEPPAGSIVRRAASRPAGGADAAAKARLELYYNLLSEKLHAVPGLRLITSANPGVPGVQYEIAVTLDETWQEVAFQVSMPFGRQNGPVLTSRSLGSLLGRSGVAVLTSLLDDGPPENPERDMEYLVERMRIEIFPPDRALLDQKLSELRNPQLESGVRRFALHQLLSAGARRDSFGGGFPPQIYRPDPALLAAATDVAMTASDPALRQQLWSLLTGPRTPRIDPAVFVAPAVRAMARESDLRVLLTLVNILGVNQARSEAREALDSIANSDSESDRPELVRMAARQILDNGAGWNDYFVARMNDPQASDAERHELISYVASATGSSARRMGIAEIKLDEPALRSLAGVMRKQGSTEVALAAARLLSSAGGAVAREEIIDFLRTGTGKPEADNKVRRSMLVSLALNLRSHPEDRPLYEEISARDLDPAMREAARQALEQTKK